jgi:hypothetical protein
MKHAEGAPMQKKDIARSGSCPPLPLEKQSQPYQPPKMEAGHDGNPPMFVPTRDVLAKDGSRERIDGPTNVNHNRLTMLFHRGIIDQCQLAAGNRLALDWELSQITPMSSSKLESITSISRGAFNHPNDAKRDAMRRHGDAVEAAGRAWPIIEAVCIKDQRVDEAAAKLHIHPRRATGQLEIGLDVLAVHYGLRQRVARSTVRQ